MSVYSRLISNNQLLSGYFQAYFIKLKPRSQVFNEMQNSVFEPTQFLDGYFWKEASDICTLSLTKLDLLSAVFSHGIFLFCLHHL